MEPTSAVFVKVAHDAAGHRFDFCHGFDFGRHTQRCHSPRQRKSPLGQSRLQLVAVLYCPHSPYCLARRLFRGAAGFFSLEGGAKIDRRHWQRLKSL